MTDEEQAWWAAFSDKVRGRTKIDCHTLGLIDDVIELEGKTLRVRIAIEGMDMPITATSKTVAFGEIRAHWRTMRPYITEEIVQAHTLELLAQSIFVFMTLASWHKDPKRVQEVEVLCSDGTGAMVRRGALNNLFGALGAFGL